jgi:hypothetical protein
MSIKLSIDGTKETVQEFVKTIKRIPKWRLYSGSKFATGRNEIHVDCYVDEQTKPTITQRKVSKVLMTSTSGANIEIILLDAQTVDMCNGTTIIRGMSYDLFSAPLSSSSEGNSN